MNATIRDVAYKAGVSRTTVSRVLNQSGYASEGTRQRVMEAMQELEYIPSALAVGLSKKETRTIGVVVPDICNAFFSEVFYAAGKVAQAQGYRLILCNTDGSLQAEAQALSDLLAYRVRGIILTPVAGQNPTSSRIINSARQMGVAVVFLDRDLEGLECDGVFVDNLSASRQAARLLLEEGHRRIAVVAGPQDTVSGRDRLAGFVEEMRAHGREPDPRYIFLGDYKAESAYRYTRLLLCADQPPTAIFSCNNDMTLGTLRAILDSGKRVPQDIALVSFDELELLESIGIHLTCVSRAESEMGERAMNLLLDRVLSGKTGDFERIIMPTRLIVRGSEKKSGAWLRTL